MKNEKAKLCEEKKSGMYCSSVSLWKTVTQPEEKLPWEVITLILKNLTSTHKDVF